MTRFNFNSQVCTSREQSEKLLALGLKKETADMIHQPIWTTPFNVWYKQEIEDDFYPAWSLHRLIEIVALCPYEIYPKDNIYDDVIYDIEEAIKEGYFNKEYLEE